MYSIAIDGPAGAGKTTVAKKLARDLDILYVDTGAFYRTIAVAIRRHRWQLSQLTTEQLQKIRIAVQLVDGMQRMILNGEDVTDFLRTPEMSKLASDCSALPVVRDYLLEAQRKLAKKESVVMEGRDIGTVVLPDATLKVFLTADLPIRAERRYKEINDPSMTLAEVEAVMRERDVNDSTRSVAPLKQAEDAYYLDSTTKTIEEVEKAILEMLHERIGVYCTNTNI